MTPTRLLAHLEQSGVKLSMRKGQLFASKTATQEQRDQIAANKEGLVAVITHQCPRCNQPLRTRLNRVDQVSYLECATDATHFGERMGVLEKINCPGEDCKDTIELADGVGWCRNHKMAVRITERLPHAD